MSGWSRLNPFRRDASWWFSRMRSDNGRPDDARRYSAWLKGDEAREHQIKMLEMVWTLSGELKGDAAINRLSEPKGRQGLTRSVRVAFVTASVVIVAVGALLTFWPLIPYETTVSTAVGQQREFELPDKSIVFLNTASSLKVRYSGFHRAIVLEHGEATFQVTKNRWRPFEVSTRFGSATALGTKFDVFLRPAAVQVVIVDGTVSIAPATGAAGQSPIVARSGELATMDSSAQVAMRRADLTPILDHRVQQLEFDRARIADAVAEFNQYSRIPLRLDSSIADLRISGVFKAGDTQSFVESVMTTLNIVSLDQDGQVTLAPR